MIKQISKFYSSSFKDFEYFAKDFIARHGGYIPPYLKKWHEKANEVHAPLRKVLGADGLDIDMSLSENHVADINVDDIAKEICHILPDYLKTYGFNKNVFNNPTIRDGKFAGVKTSKHISIYANRHVSDRNTRLQLDKLISSLGKAWSTASCDDIDLKLTISTTPKAFMLLGHYSPDKDSCFRQNSDSTMHKYILAQTRGTFVITLATTWPNSSSSKIKNVSRIWGFCDPEHKVFNACNIYNKPRFNEGNIVNAIREYLEYLNQDKYSIYRDAVSNVQHVFLNENTLGTFAPKGWQISRQELVGDRDGITIHRCFKCQDRYNYGDTNLIDDEVYCYRCGANANTCQVTHKLTFKDLSPMIVDNKSVYMVHPDIVLLDIVKKCKSCGINTVDSKELAQLNNVR